MEKIVSKEEFGKLVFEAIHRHVGFISGGFCPNNSFEPWVKVTLDRTEYSCEEHAEEEYIKLCDEAKIPKRHRFVLPPHDDTRRLRDEYLDKQNENIQLQSRKNQE